MGDQGGSMGDMEMPLPDNTLPMMTGQGPFGGVEMGGMFTTVKIRKGLARNDYKDPGWYTHPAGTVAAVRSGCEAQKQDFGVRVTESWHGFGPVRLVAVGGAFDPGFDCVLNSTGTITAFTIADNARMDSSDRDLSGGKEHLFSPLRLTISY